MHIFIENTWAPVQVSKQAIYCKTVRRTWRTNFTRKKAAPSYVPGSPCQALSYAIQRLKLLSIHLPFRALCNTKSSAQLYHNNDATWCNQHGFESLHILPAVWNLSSLSIVLFQTTILSALVKNLKVKQLIHYQGFFSDRTLPHFTWAMICVRKQTSAPMHGSKHIHIYKCSMGLCCVWKYTCIYVCVYMCMVVLWTALILQVLLPPTGVGSITIRCVRGMLTCMYV